MKVKKKHPLRFRHLEFPLLREILRVFVSRNMQAMNYKINALQREAPVHTWAFCWNLQNNRPPKSHSFQLCMFTPQRSVVCSLYLEKEHELLLSFKQYWPQWTSMGKAMQKHMYRTFCSLVTNCPLAKNKNAQKACTNNKKACKNYQYAIYIVVGHNSCP